MILRQQKADHKEMLDELPLSELHKLMVVAHPDDETLWGGAT